MQRLLYLMERAFTPYSSSTSQKACCNICYAHYNLSNNLPLLVCYRNHSICKACLKSIKLNLRCPFCRENIRTNYIRLNKQAVELIKAKQQWGHKKRFIKVLQNERLATANDEDQIVDVSDLLPEQRVVVRNHQPEEDRTSLNILIFIQLFFFQILFGIYAFYYGLVFREEKCFAEYGIKSEFIRDILLVQGYVESTIGMLTIYFTLFYYFNLLTYRHLACCYVGLLILTEIKSCIFSIVYMQLISDQSFTGCSIVFKNYALSNTCSNIFQLLLGMFLIRTVLRSALRRRN